MLLQPSLVPSLFSLVTLFQFDLLRLCKEPILVISIKCFYFLLTGKEPGKYQKGVGEASSWNPKMGTPQSPGNVANHGGWEKPLAEVVSYMCLVGSSPEACWVVLELQTVHLQKHQESCVLMVRHSCTCTPWEACLSKGIMEIGDHQNQWETFSCLGRMKLLWRPDCQSLRCLGEWNWIGSNFIWFSTGLLTYTEPLIVWFNSLVGTWSLLMVV